jgi:hypothetical protein
MAYNPQLENKFRNWCKNNFMTGSNKNTYNCKTKETYEELTETLNEFHKVIRKDEYSITYRVMSGEVRVISMEKLSKGTN